MSLSIRILIACASLSPLAASADTQVCDLVGEVQRSESIASLGESSVYSFKLRIVEATAEGSAVCDVHLGKSMEVDLTLPERAGKPAKGDRIAFRRNDVGGPEPYIDYRFTARQAAGG
jgi:hypothetical protein